MTEKDILLIKHSWSYLAGQQDNLTTSYVKVLRQTWPDHSTLMAKSQVTANVRELISLIHQIVAALPSIGSVESALFNTIDRLSHLNLNSSDYESAFIAFLMTLEKKLGNAFSREIREAWTMLFVTLGRQIPQSKRWAQRIEN